ncbi:MULTISPECIES: hypothetical protein [Pseudomonas]|uniref:hypothetical protein n=1 Tax=Pseudomonas nitroreducens TaxID=46680 RepID=UPI001E57CCF0|nr:MULTISPECIES: hypothetical protein [Pseudomonas]MCE4073411.1 hypothetical protein [Pseudomonas nitritireducens]MCE4079707.1 hypothetical protein [Pseudomonas nitroreducens]
MARKIRHMSCHHCSKLFYARSMLAKYCSKKCSNAAFRSKNEPSQAELKKLFELQNGVEISEDTELMDAA